MAAGFSSPARGYRHAFQFRLVGSRPSSRRSTRACRRFSGTRRREPTPPSRALLPLGLIFFFVHPIELPSEPFVPSIVNRVSLRRRIHHEEFVAKRTRPSSVRLKVASSFLACRTSAVRCGRRGGPVQVVCDGQDAAVWVPVKSGDRVSDEPSHVDIGDAGRAGEGFSLRGVGQWFGRAGCASTSSVHDVAAFGLMAHAWCVCRSSRPSTGAPLRLTSASP